MKYYIKPIIEITYNTYTDNILINHSEPEITSNIGANENNTFDNIEDNNIKTNLWDE